MNVAIDEIIVTKSITILDFNLYEDVTDCLNSTFIIRAENFCSRWKLIIHPRSAKCEAIESINCDVHLKLQCNYSTSPYHHLNLLSIQSAVESRENYPTILQKDKDCIGDPTWRQTLISHVTLKSCKFSVPNQLKFNLQFRIPADIFLNSIDGWEDIPRDLSKMKGRLEFCDAFFVTSSNSLIGFNTAIVKCRSRLLETCEEISAENCSHFVPPVVVPEDFEKAKIPISKVPSRSNIKSNLLTRFDQNNVASSKSPGKRTVSMMSPRKFHGTPSKKPTQTSLASFFASPQSKTSSPSRHTPQKALFVHDQENVLSAIEKGEIEKYGARNPLQDSVGKSSLKYYKLNMSNSVAEAMVEWLYMGETCKLAELASPLLVASIRHGIPSLSTACQFHLASTLSINTIPGTLVTCWKYGANILNEKAMSFAIEHRKELITKNEWEETMCNYPKIMFEFTRRLSY